MEALKNKYPIQIWDPYISFDKSKYKIKKSTKYRTLYTSLDDKSRVIEIFDENSVNQIIYKKDKIKQDGFSKFKLKNNILSEVVSYKNDKICSINSEPSIIVYKEKKLYSLTWTKDAVVSNFEGPAKIVFGDRLIRESYFINGTQLPEYAFHNMKSRIFNKNYEDISKIKSEVLLSLYKEFAEYFRVQEMVDYVDSIIVANKLEKNF